MDTPQGSLEDLNAQWFVCSITLLLTLPMGRVSYAPAPVYLQYIPCVSYSKCSSSEESEEELKHGTRSGRSSQYEASAHATAITTNVFSTARSRNDFVVHSQAADRYCSTLYLPTMEKEEDIRRIGGSPAQIGTFGIRYCGLAK